MTNREMHKVNGIAYIEKGPPGSVPLIMIHGFPLSHAMWDPQWAALPDTKRIIAYDVRGHGDSDVGDGQYSIEFFVDDLIDLMDALRIPKAILCGLSMGGYIALRAVERHPERVAGMVLADTRSEADSDEAKVKRSKAVRLIRQRGLPVYAGEFVKGTLAESTLRNKPDLVQRLIRLIEKNSPLGVCGALFAMSARTDTTKALSRLNVPTLVLVGEADSLTPPESAAAMARLIPSAKYQVVPQAAHLSNLENPQAFNSFLNDFLSRF